MGVNLTIEKESGALIASFHVRPILIDRVREAQDEDDYLRQLKEAVSNGTRTDFTLRRDGALMFGNRICAPNLRDIKREILEEAYSSAYVMHPGGTKMYRTLKPYYWWRNMKREIAAYVSRCLVCQQCRTPLCWNEVGERKLIGPEIVRITTEKVKLIKEKLRAAQSRQKSYADNRRKDLEFQKGDWVFLKLSPWKGVVRFGKRGKLSPRYIGPFMIKERVGPVAYKLILPLRLSKIHDVFHVSLLRKYIADPAHVLEEQPIRLKEDLTYEEKPIQILDRREQVLRNKTIPLVKVLWSNHLVEEATWEPEDLMRRQYPHLF
ncbi:uncharacterized protein LOC112163713 [Rosa chinensis]|uniref:uncharacterized protein LOC112163713 n=1 Tax=Rosa chinensis TaxID=74649 RepID=UPI000D08C7BC|nr:uncharacterized protein LOC112163713 [Rosa chinensis]